MTDSDKNANAAKTAGGRDPVDARDGDSGGNGLAPGLVDILKSLESDGSGMRAPIPDSWLQGRTAFGGLTAALLLGAVERAFADAAPLPPLRSVLVNFVAPVGGAPRFACKVLRKGRNVTTISADALSEDREKTLARATFAFGGGLGSAATREVPSPGAPAPEEAPDMAPPGSEGFRPAFLDNFEVRLVAGSRPYASAPEGMARAWSRHRDPRAHAGTAPLACLADVLPPAALIVRDGNCMASTATWICNFLRPEGATRDGWFQVETALTAEMDGYSSQILRIWDRDGRQVAESMQSAAVFETGGRPAGS